MPNPPATSSPNGGGQASGEITCPDPAGSIGAAAAAQAEVDRELQNLQQIDEANDRLVDTVGQGGPNFVQNAILGPLDERTAARPHRHRDRTLAGGARPQLADSPLRRGFRHRRAQAPPDPAAGGGMGKGPETGNGNAGGGNGGGGQAGSISARTRPGRSPLCPRRHRPR